MLGSLFQAAGDLLGGIAGYTSGKYNADEARVQARIALEQAAEAEARFRRDAARFQGTFRARAGGSGLTAGSFLDAETSNIVQQELDALTVRYKGALAARGYRVQAKLYKRQAQFALAGGYLSAGADLLGAAGGGGSLLMGGSDTPGGAGGGGGYFSSPANTPSGGWV